jgi:hypothetical protein
LDANLLPSPDPRFQFIQFGVLGNPDVELPAITSAEIGYRAKLSDKWSSDIEFFYTQGQDFITRFVRASPISPTTLRFDFNTQNDNLRSTQTGATFSVDYTGAKNQLRAFVNLQWTDLENFSPFDAEAEKGKMYDIRNYKSAPNWYGGIYWHHQFSAHWQLNLNAYFFGNHEVWHRIDRSFLQREFNRNNFVRAGTGAEIKGKFSFNAKLMFSPVKQITTFINIRNLLNQTGFEYYFTDRLGLTFLGGINFKI